MTWQCVRMAAVLAALAGCSTSSLDGPIDYKVTGGLSGHGDGTPALHIELDGTMTRTPPGGQPEVRLLDGATLQAVRDKVERAQLATLSDYYACCPDDFVQQVSAELGGALHIVKADNLADKPPALADALAALHDLATQN